MAEAAGSTDPTASPSPIHHRWWGLALKVLAALVVVGLGAWLWYVAIEPQEARLEQLLSQLGPPPCRSTHVLGYGTRKR